MSYPSIYEIQDILFDEGKCVEFLRSKHVFYEEWTCSKHDKPLKYYANRFRFRCTAKKCSEQVSLRIHSFFHTHKLPIYKILHLGYLWLKNERSFSIHGTTKHSKHTVADFSAFFRELVTESLDEVDVIIGGPGIVVELDETKIGKRKYNRGHQVDGVWILGGVERTSERKIFAVSVPDRTAETLISVIFKQVRPGSIIHTDLWRGYLGLDRLNDYTHLTVNHSQNFKDPDTGVHTNTIEGTWCAIKYSIPIRNRTKDCVDKHLWEFIWRRKNKDRLWDAFIEALANVHYD